MRYVTTLAVLLLVIPMIASSSTAPAESKAVLAVQKLRVGMPEEEVKKILRPVSMDWGRVYYGGSGRGRLYFQTSQEDQVWVEIGSGPDFPATEVGPIERRRSLGSEWAETPSSSNERGEPDAPDNSLRRCAPSLVSDLNRSAKKRNHMELEVTWKRATRVWWSYLWRNLVAILASMVVGFICGGIMGLILGLFGASAETIRIVVAPISVVLGLGISIVPVKMILGKDYGAFRVVLLAKEEPPVVAIPSTEPNQSPQTTPVSAPR